MKKAIVIVLACAALAACYKCRDPQCSNVPPVEPDYPSAPADAGAGG